MSEEIKINVSGEKSTLEILRGEALPQREPNSVQIDGLISAPFEYLEKRQPEQKSAYLVVDRAVGLLTLTADERSPYKDVISGKLRINPEFDKFGINTGKNYDTFELADFIKMNRYYFSDKNVAMKLVSDLKNFKANVSKEIENSNNDRGNTRLLQSQVVDSNIPEAFDIVIPIFKGQPEQTFRVEINIDARDFSCTLISPDANDLMNDFRDKAINEQIYNIREIAPDLAILEV